MHIFILLSRSVISYGLVAMFLLLFLVIIWCGAIVVAIVLASAKKSEPPSLASFRAPWSEYYFSYAVYRRSPTNISFRPFDATSSLHQSTSWRQRVYWFCTDAFSHFETLHDDAWDECTKKSLARNVCVFNCKSMFFTFLQSYAPLWWPCKYRTLYNGCFDSI